MANTIEVFNDAGRLVPWENTCKVKQVFDKTSLSYKQVVQLETTSPRSMKAYNITSGPAKGYSVLLVAPPWTTTLFDLPIELREMVYKDFRSLVKAKYGSKSNTGDDAAAD